MSESLLRGASSAAEKSEELNASSEQTFLRILHEAVTGHDHASPASSENGDSSSSDPFLMFMTVIVGMICVCYVICMIQLIRMCFCRRRFRENADQANVLIRDGSVIFNLTGMQRRAVLEAIFSDNSKAVTKEDFPQKKEEKEMEQNVHLKKDIDDDAGVFPDIPQSSLKDTRDMGTDEAPDVEASNGTSLAPTASFSSPRHDPPVVPSAPSDGSGSSGISDAQTLEIVNRRFSWQDSSPSEQDPSLPISASDEALCLPALDEEECKEEEEEYKEEEKVAVLPSVSAVTSMDSFAENRSNEYDYSDSDDDAIVCAICLSSYHEGEVLVTSKYCSHLFHKECIFEWLEKHDVCPCCRVDMVTAGEINRAATTLVGKQRMCKAIQTRAAATLPTPPASPTALNRSRSPVSPTALNRTRSPRVRRVGQSFR